MQTETPMNGGITLLTRFEYDALGRHKAPLRCILITIAGRLLADRNHSGIYRYDYAPPGNRPTRHTLT